MVKVISKDTALAERRSKEVREIIPFEVGDEQHEIEKVIVNGEMEVIQLNKPLGEMITHGSIEDLKDIVGKAALDVELGREETPLLYKAIYDEISDPNLPRVLDAKWALTGACIFLEHMEGGEVKFGSLEAEKGPTARINTYTSGFEITRELVDFNENYKINMFTNALGSAYNALLNHIYLSPIIEYAYKAANTTKAVAAGENMPQWVGIYNSLREGVKDARAAKRSGDILLANSVDEMDIMQALKGQHTVSGTVQPAIAGITTVIFYDGESDIKVGKKNYEYAGVKPGEAYIVRSKKGFKELTKKPLTIEVGNKDISRLVEDQIVGHSHKGAFAAVEENVQKVILY